MLVQLDNIDAKVFTHDKYGNSMVIKDDNFKKFRIQQLEQELKIQNSVMRDEFDTVRIKLRNMHKVDGVQVFQSRNITQTNKTMFCYTGWK